MYEPVGYAQVPDGVVVLGAAAHLHKTGTMEAALDKLHTALKKHGKRWYKFTLAELAAITAETAEDLSMKAIVHIFMHMLKAAGRLDETIPVLTYRNNPSMTIDQVATRIAAIDIQWPTLPPLPQLLNNGEFEVNLRYALNHLEQLVIMRPTIVERLREYARHIRWMIKQGRELSQVEKTFFLHANDPVYGVSEHLKETDLPTSLLVPAEMRTLDPLAVLAKLQQVTQPGPQMDYLVMMSNTNLEDLVMYQGAWAPSLIVSAGFIVPLGLFETFNLEVVDNISWTAEEHMRGSLETGLTSKSFKGQFPNGGKLMDALFPKIAVTRDNTVMDKYGIHLIPDLPDIKLIWRQDQVMFSFYSSLRKRTMEGRETADYFVSAALQSAQIGAAKHNDLTLDRWGVVDTTELRSLKHLPDLTGQIFNTFKPTMQAWHVKRGAKKLNETPVEMGPFMLHYGTSIVKPALSEFYRPNRDLLFADNPDAMRYLRGRLGMTDTEYLRSQLPLKISFNAWRLGSLYGKLPATDTADDKAMAKIRRLALAVLRGD